MNNRAITGLPDDRDRINAVATSGRNIVVTAGAGTGKTTLLVDRVTHLLMRSTSPLKITDIIAITFTKKAANEMKVRLRNRLKYFIEEAGQAAFISGSQRNGYEDSVYDDILQRYNLSHEAIKEKAVDAINNLEKAQIGTIHSFAGHILRLFPIEAGIAPDFREDEGPGFNDHFEREWEEWLDSELSAGSRRGSDWKEVLCRIPFESVRTLARRLCNEAIPIISLDKDREGVLPDQSFMDWLESDKNRAQLLLNKYGEGRKVKMHDLLMRSVALFDDVRMGRNISLFDDTAPSKHPSGWLEEDYIEAARIISVARILSMADEQFIRKLTSLVLPFTIECRRRFVISGNVSFDGLLAFCCNILKNNKNIRDYLKENFRYILVDEFQDTDPLQYEIILYLAEDEGCFESDWRSIKLSEGKLFIVGDPKQSIYAFRGADIGAYHNVINMIIRQGGTISNLSTNFRSHSGIINAVNGVCSKMIHGHESVQPEYVEINACPGHDALMPLQRVELRLVDLRNEDDGEAADATECEALAIGNFISEEMIGKEIISDADGGEMPVSPRHIAILLPKLTQVHEYLDVLKRLQIPYIIEGDRHFYGSQEVIDFVNLLRVLDNPLDRTAMAGILRSPLGGFSDRELYELCRFSLDDYRIEDFKLNEVMRSLGDAGFRREALEKFKTQTHEFYSLMRRLYTNVPVMPVPDAIHYIFDNTPVLQLAASSYQGEQSVANLQKIYRIANGISDMSNLTLKRFTALLEERVASREKEGESLLSEEGVDAVRILSIHRAKGLEFPVVIVGGLHGIPNRGGDSAAVTHDWSAGTTGVSAGGVVNLQEVRMRDKRRLVEKEEKKRLLYVAMTRAKECLILSGVLGKRSYKDSYLSMLMRALGDGAGDGGIEEINIGSGTLKQTILDRRTLPISASKTEETGDVDMRGLMEKIDILPDVWDRRDKTSREIMAKPCFLTPSSMEKGVASPPGRKTIVDSGTQTSRERGILIGKIAHFVLENWDFEADAPMFRCAVEDACRKLIPYDFDRAGVESEVIALFEKFSASSAYEELRTAEIVGREVPFTMPWNGQIMEGIIDIIYRDGGRLYAGDYKTDNISAYDLESRISRYSMTANIYMRALLIGTDYEVAGFKFIFMHPGKSVLIPCSSMDLTRKKNSS